MTGRTEQDLADARENAAARRYQREQSLAAVVTEAMRRADAMSRLDASLRVGERRPAA
jgi:hypothetical protein